MIKRQGREFTLVELLITVAMIAILVALLLPALTDARNKARALVCLTNVRTISQAFSLYASDNQRRFAQIGIGNSEASGSSHALRTWHYRAADQLLNYAGGRHQIFGCTSLSTISEATWTAGDVANPGIYR
jgi:type II secretory pathway pseudopilin PulG